MEVRWERRKGEHVLGRRAVLSSSHHASKEKDTLSVSLLEEPRLVGLGSSNRGTLHGPLTRLLRQH